MSGRAYNPFRAYNPSLRDVPGGVRELAATGRARAGAAAGRAAGLSREAYAKLKQHDAKMAAGGAAALGAGLTTVAAVRAYRRAKARGASTGAALRAAAVPAAVGGVLTAAASYGAARALGWEGGAMPAMPDALRFSNLSSSTLMLFGARPAQGGRRVSTIGDPAERNLQGAGVLGSGSLQGALPSKDGPEVANFPQTAEEPAGFYPPLPASSSEEEFEGIGVTGRTSGEYERGHGLDIREAKRAAKMERRARVSRKATAQVGGGQQRKTAETGRIAGATLASERARIAKEAKEHVARKRQGI